MQVRWWGWWAVDLYRRISSEPLYHLEEPSVF